MRPLCAALLGSLLVFPATARETPPEPGTPRDFTLPGRETLVLDNGLAITFIDFGRVPQQRALPAEGVSITGGLRLKLDRLIDDLGLSVRSLNSLKNSNIRTLRDLVEFSEEELLKVKNVGEKAVAEIAELLQREGLRFGMAFEEVEGELRVARSGGAAADSAGPAQETM